MRRILRLFEVVSVLNMNLGKSSLIGINVGEERVSNMADIFWCEVAKFPLNYLGLPIGVNPRSISLWDPVVENFERRLSMWNGNYLSIGGRPI